MRPQPWLLALAWAGAAGFDGPTGALKVRFTNLSGGAPDVVTTVPRKTNLLTIADEVGVHIPRACRNGLCGTCECALIDPSGEETVVRTCSTNVAARSDAAGDEVVVDVGRRRAAGYPGTRQN